MKLAGEGGALERLGRSRRGSNHPCSIARGVPEPTPNPSQEGSGVGCFVPLLGGVRGGSTRGGFMESLHDFMIAHWDHEPARGHPGRFGCWAARTGESGSDALSSLQRKAGGTPARRFMESQAGCQRTSLMSGRDTVRRAACEVAPYEKKSGENQQAAANHIG